MSLRSLAFLKERATAARKRVTTRREAQGKTAEGRPGMGRSRGSSGSLAALRSGGASAMNSIRGFWEGKVSRRGRCVFSCP